MAEAIAVHLIKRRRGLIPTTVRSAGTAATEGAPASIETAEALRSVGVKPLAHRSRALTPGLVAGAQIIYVMTPSHLQAVRAMGPSAAARAVLLDPQGDVPDPIGMVQEVYNQTAHRLAELISTRLEELDA